jgi:hypothetical protein
VHQAQDELREHGARDEKEQTVDATLDLGEIRFERLQPLLEAGTEGGVDRSGAGGAPCGAARTGGFEQRLDVGVATRAASRVQVGVF